MARRSVDFNEGLAQELRDPEFAKAFILDAMECGDSLQEALRNTIRAYGVQEFADECGIAKGNLLNALQEDANPTRNTLEAILQPFGLKLGVASVEQAS